MPKGIGYGTKGGKKKSRKKSGQKVPPQFLSTPSSRGRSKRKK